MSELHFPATGFAIRSDDRAELGESPVWCARTEYLWWVDIDGRALLRTRHRDGKTTRWATPELPGFVVLTEDGTPAVGMQSGIFLFDQAAENFDKIVDLPVSGVRFNDATVDGSGCLWAGTMEIGPMGPMGILYSVGPDLALEPRIEGFRTINGLAFDPLHNRLYVSDSYPSIKTIWSMDCAPASGELGQKQVFAKLHDLKGAPDGARVDSDGNYWIVGVNGGVIHVFSAEGVHLKEINTPFQAPTKLTFAGDNLGDIYLTSKGGDNPNGALGYLSANADFSVQGQPLPAWKIGQPTPVIATEQPSNHI